MARQERLQPIAIGNFDRAIYTISEAGVPGISDMAKRSLIRLDAGELGLRTNIPDFVSPSITGFVLDVAPRSAELRGAIILDIGKMCESSDEKIQADLVRTLAVADTFPDNGYQDRLHTVYSNALDTQKTWLEQQDSNPIPFDPRSNKREDLIKQFMGKQHYSSDFGIEDWNKACDFWADDPDMQHPNLPGLSDNIGQMISMRYEYTHLLYDAFLKSGVDFSKNPADERAKFMANGMVGMVLTRPDQG